MGPHFLEPLFKPRSVALIGGSSVDEAIRDRVISNLIADLKADLFLIDAKNSSLQGHPCLPSLSEVGQPIDLAVILGPTGELPALLRDCGEHGVKTAALLCAGFVELGRKGPRLREEALQIARGYRMRLLGPASLGLIRPSLGLNASSYPAHAYAGGIALVSQSGALCSALLDWAASRQLGLSTVVTLGELLDIRFGEVLSYLAQDRNTRSILLYVEAVRDARAFMSGLRMAARVKPVVVLKGGRFAEGKRSAASHSGELINSDAVFEAALERAGVVRARTLEQLFDAAQILASGVEVTGPRLALLTNGAGPGVVAADYLRDRGLQLAELSRESVSVLDRLLPKYAARSNPIDLLADATPQHYREAATVLLADPQIDGLLTLFTPQRPDVAVKSAEALIEVGGGKALLASWIGAGQVKEARERFNASGIPHFETPEAAVEAFSHLATYRRNQRLLMQVPGPLSHHRDPDLQGARLIIEGALAEGRKALNHLEAKALLAAFHIPTLPAIPTRSGNEALAAAQTLGYPVVMKVDAEGLIHKSDVGGVRLDINSPQIVRGVYTDLIDSVREKRPDATIRSVIVERQYRAPHRRELIVGVARDPVFGPAITFGAGGTAVEVIRDSATALPPLNRLLIDQLIDHTRVARALGSFREMPPIDREALEAVLLRVSEMVCELPEIMEMDINPLMVDPHGAMAVDVKIQVGYPPAGQGRYDHMAIHPYPTHLVSRRQLADGNELIVRPIRPEDAELTQRFTRQLSEQSRYFRFMQSLQELTPEMLVRFTQIDYDRELALMAVIAQDEEEIEVGVCRYSAGLDAESCEFALVVADDWQGKGIGSQLMHQLFIAAKAARFKTMEGEVLAENNPMLSLVKKLGFVVKPHPEDTALKWVERSL